MPKAETLYMASLVERNITHGNLQQRRRDKWMGDIVSTILTDIRGEKRKIKINACPYPETLTTTSVIG